MTTPEPITEVEESQVSKILAFCCDDKEIHNAIDVQSKIASETTDWLPAAWESMEDTPKYKLYYSSTGESYARLLARAIILWYTRPPHSKDKEAAAILDFARSIESDFKVPLLLCQAILLLTNPSFK